MSARNAFPLISFLVFVIIAMPASAIDGVLEINQACAAVGCFPGDAPGLPVEITTSGSYRLTGNVTGPGTSTTLIEVDSDDVTIDLNGFTLRAGLVGVRATSSFARTEVRNGVVRDSTKGIQLNQGSRVERVRVFNNFEDGIRVGDHSIVMGCTAAGNGFAGIVGSSGDVVRANVASGNGHEGIRAGGTIVENVAVLNGGAGIFAAALSTVSRNAAVENGQASASAGIVADTGSTVTENLASQNSGYGLDLAGTFGAGAGYARNVVQHNSSGSNNQVNGGIEMDLNVCGTSTGDNDTTCP